MFCGNADKSVSCRPWTGSAVLFLQSLCTGVNLLSLYKDSKGKFIVLKVIKLTLSDSAGGLAGYEILKVHDGDPFLGVDIKTRPSQGLQGQVFLPRISCGIPGRQHHSTPIPNRPQKITPAFQTQQQQPIGFGQVEHFGSCHQEWNGNFPHRRPQAFIPPIIHGHPHIGAHPHSQPPLLSYPPSGPQVTAEPMATCWHVNFHIEVKHPLHRSNPKSE
uniref:Uncharacterized protein n=1 Tax=Neogobius melanostomus TaxID=47308 RepID=A0A8C6SJC2_9GOBI